MTKKPLGAMIRHVRKFSRGGGGDDAGRNMADGKKFSHDNLNALSTGGQSHHPCHTNSATRE